MQLNTSFQRCLARRQPASKHRLLLTRSNPFCRLFITTRCFLILLATLNRSLKMPLGNELAGTFLHLYWRSKAKDSVFSSLQSTAVNGATSSTTKCPMNERFYRPRLRHNRQQLHTSLFFFNALNVFAKPYSGMVLPAVQQRLDAQSTIYIVKLLSYFKEND